MIREKTPQERAALLFKSAGLGDRSAIEAARLLRHSGMSFEAAAVLGQRLDEESKATTATIQEAARRHHRATHGPPTATAWGRPVQEATTAPLPLERSSPQAHPERTKMIDGVLHHEVVEYEPVVRESAVEEPRRRSAWGRNLEG